VVEKRVLQKAGEAAAGIASGADQDTEAVAEGLDVVEGATFTNEELREFLEADSAGDLADPEFKERLRQKLWDLVQRRTGKLPSDGH
jgi:hypothetical protein